MAEKEMETLNDIQWACTKKLHGFVKENDGNYNEETKELVIKELTHLKDAKDIFINKLLSVPEIDEKIIFDYIDRIAEDNKRLSEIINMEYDVSFTFTDPCRLALSLALQSRAK